MKRSNNYKIAAAVVFGLTAILWLVKGIADILGGVSGGILNLILSIGMFCLTLLSWNRPLLGGIISAVLAVILAVYFNLQLPNIYIAYIPMFLMCAPMVLSGLLFIEADWAKKKRD
jgi:hypothetical protein